MDERLSLNRLATIGAVDADIAFRQIAGVKTRFTGSFAFMYNANADLRLIEFLLHVGFVEVRR